jgi:hypothetical protein
MTCHCIGPPGACPCIMRGHYHFTPYAPNLPPFQLGTVPLTAMTPEDVRRIIREELERLGVGKSAVP